MLLERLPTCQHLPHKLLPSEVKLVLPKGFAELIQQHRLKRSDGAKKAFANQEFKPETWDMGEEANTVLPRPQGKPVEGKK